jgi:pentose-5-phosphate-3-epimerase
MTISPGWGGQPFIARSPEDRAATALLDGGADAPVALEVDGGIDLYGRSTRPGGHDSVRGRLGDLRGA